jgi:hypothetical protein
MSNARLAVKVLLIVFVAVSMLAIFMRNQGEGPGEEDESAILADGDSKIIAYYFHGNKRCKTCLTIELYAIEAIESGFPEALNSGALEFMPVNLELPENEHFIDDFQLAARTVVLERITDGQRGDYLDLRRVWELVGDREAFFEYVQDETERFMSGESQ